MKKIISSILILTFLLSACSKKQETVITEPIVFTEVLGIGKVLPQSGIVLLSVSSPNKVVKINKKVGDSVKIGDVLFEMESVSDELRLQQTQAEITNAKANTTSIIFDKNAAEIKLAELKYEFEISKKLYAQNAETKQKVFLDSIAYMQQLQIVNQNQQKLLANQAIVSEKVAQSQIDKQTVADKKFKALQNGVLILFDVTVGQVLNPNTTFGEIAPNEALVVEGELDELYADKLKLNQTVQIYLVGQTQVIAEGKISYVGFSLQNKSILYEQVGEGTDRRVRRFTVTITAGQQHLLINQKVECKIKI